MTGKPNDDGLAEIKRLLKSLDEASAGERPPPPKVSLARDMAGSAQQTGSSPLEDLPKVAPPSSPPALRAADGPASRPPALLIALLSLLVAAGGFAAWWLQPGLLTAGIGKQSTEKRDTFAASATSAAVPAVKPAPEMREPPSDRQPVPPPVAEAAPAAVPPARIAQAVRSQSAVTEVPKSPSVDVQEPKLRAPARLTGIAGQTIPVPIEVETLAAASAVVVIAGLPAGSKPNRGMPRPSGDWGVSAAEIANLSINLPSSAVGRHPLTIELRAVDAVVLASVSSILEIAPAPGRAPMADAVRAPEATAMEWLAEAKRLINAGHIASSRLVLERAADAGLGEAARLLGDTYDPAKLYALGVRGVSGDIARAIHWYERADELGDPQAKARLLALSGR